MHSTKTVFLGKSNRFYDRSPNANGGGNWYESGNDVNMKNNTYYICKTTLFYEK